MRQRSNPMSFRSKRSVEMPQRLLQEETNRKQRQGKLVFLHLFYLRPTSRPAVGSEVITIMCEGADISAKNARPRQVGCVCEQQWGRERICVRYKTSHSDRARTDFASSVRPRHHATVVYKSTPWKESLSVVNIQVHKTHHASKRQESFGTMPVPVTRRSDLWLGKLGGQWSGAYGNICHREPSLCRFSSTCQRTSAGLESSRVENT